MLQVITKLLISSILGGLIGFEREKHGRPAGVRTHLLVCLGSCLTMVVSLRLYEIFKIFNTLNYASGVDPSRLASMVMAGIGFVGAGVIVKGKEGNVWGLTTAACLWVTAALGLAVGAGMIIPSVAATLIAILSLLVLKSIESIIAKEKYYKLHIETNCIYSSTLKEIVAILKRSNFKILNMDFEKNSITGLNKYTICIKSKNNINNYFVEFLSKIEGVKKISCK